MKILFCLLLIIGSCSFKKDNQKQKGHEELYSEPDAPKLSSLDPNEKRIVIASTNDRHGHLNTPPVIFEDDHNKKELSMQIGGTQLAKEYTRILRDTFKNVVLVDSGDLFSDKMDIDPIKNYYSSLGYDAYTVGLRDFNLKVPANVGSNTKMFEALAKASPTPLLVSNLYELKTARVAEWPGAKPYVLKDLGGVKVGIIGLIPDDIVAQTPVNNRVGYFVENMVQSTLRNSRLLRSLGADVIVVLTHQGIDCDTALAEKTNLPADKVNFDPLKENVCDLKNPLGEYLQKLPPNLVNVVISGRNHQKTANIINGIVVMSGFPDGRSFNYVELVVDTKTNKIVPEKTVVHQPVLFCSEFFKETNDCYTGDSTVNHKNRVPASFLGKPITYQPIAYTSSPELKSMKNIGNGLINFKADLTYSPDSSEETQLMVMNVTGKELLKILEEDYNLGRKNHWQPSPYLLSGDDLSISISGVNLELNKTYRILSDLESLQTHKVLHKFITRYDSESHMSLSWKSMEEDSVNSRMAAQVR